MRYSNDKDINRLVRTLVRAGWCYRHGRHGKLIPPHSHSVLTVPKTPSDRRAFQNFNQDIRRLCRKTKTSYVGATMDGHS